MSHAGATNAIVDDLRRSSTMYSTAQGLDIVYRHIESLELRRVNSYLFQPVLCAQDSGPPAFINAFKSYYLTKESDTIREILEAGPTASRMSTNWNAHVKKNMRAICETLESANNTSLPVLKTHPGFISWRNGQYDLVCVFVCIWVLLFMYSPTRCVVLLQYADILLGYGDKRKVSSRSSFSPVAFEKQDMDIFDDLRDDQNFKTGIWYELRHHCPVFFSMIEHQYPPVTGVGHHSSYTDPERNIRIFLAFLGRLLVPLDTFDKWQKALAIIGTSGVGKTKLLEFIQGVIGHRDVFNLKSEGTEMTFGFETAEDARLCVVEELTSESSIAGSMMLSMVCGSKAFIISRKNKQQTSMPFNMPMIIVGNSFPKDWPNESGMRNFHLLLISFTYTHNFPPRNLGQTRRRFLVSHWDHTVPPAMMKTDLPDALEEERPVILLLIMRAYFSLVRTMSQKGDSALAIELILTADMIRDGDTIILQNNDVRQFMQTSGLVRFDKHGVRSKKMIPVDVLVNEYNKFTTASQRGGATHRMSAKEFNAILDYAGAVRFVDSKDDADGPARSFKVPAYKRIR